MIAYLHCMYCKVKTRIQGEESHKPRSRCASVWKMMLELFWYSLDKHDLSLTMSSLRYGYLFFSFSFFDMSFSFLATLFLIPFHSHISFARISKRDHTCGRTVLNNTLSEALVFHYTLSTPKDSYIG